MRCACHSHGVTSLNDNPDPEHRDTALEWTPSEVGLPNFHQKIIQIHSKKPASLGVVSPPPCVPLAAVSCGTRFDHGTERLIGVQSLVTPCRLWIEELSSGSVRNPSPNPNTPPLDVGVDGVRDRFISMDGNRHTRCVLNRKDILCTILVWNTVHVVHTLGRSPPFLNALSISWHGVHVRSRVRRRHRS